MKKADGKKPRTARRGASQKAVEAPRVAVKKRRTQDERSAETKQNLIQAAIDIVCDRGYANLTTAEIAKRADVSRGALQHHFRTRSDLLIAVADHLTENMLRLGEKIGGVHLSLEDRIDSAIRHYLAAYLDPNFLAILNMLVGITNDVEMGHRARLINIQQGSDGPWLALFADTGLSQEQLAVARRLTLSALRGMAVARFLGILTTSVEADLKLLKSMLLQLLRGNHASREPLRVGAAGSVRQPAKVSQQQ